MHSPIFPVIQFASGHFSGITLIEILVALAIVGILSAVTIPAYQNYVKKARMVEGKTAVRDVASLELVSPIPVDDSVDNQAVNAWPQVTTLRPRKLPKC